MARLQYLLLLCCNLCDSSGVVLNPLTRGYEDITVVIDKELAPEDCQKILKDIKAALTGASASIYTFLSGQVLIGEVTVQVPSHWSQLSCGIHLAHSHHTGVGTDIYILSHIYCHILSHSHNTVCVSEI